MAPHVSRFVAALFRVDAAAAGIARSTRELDALFRFKVDFVRKRALPLVKGGVHVGARPGRRRRRARRWRGRGRHARSRAGDRDGRLRAARSRGRRCAPPAPTRRRRASRAQIDALKRWCAACLHDPGYGPGSSSGFPRRSTTSISCRCSGRVRICREAMLGPDDRLRRRDGFKLTDPRAERRARS